MKARVEPAKVWKRTKGEQFRVTFCDKIPKRRPKRVAGCSIRASEDLLRLNRSNLEWFPHFRVSTVCFTKVLSSRNFLFSFQFHEKQKKKSHISLARTICWSSAFFAERSGFNPWRSCIPCMFQGRPPSNQYSMPYFQKKVKRVPGAFKKFFRKKLKKSRKFSPF